MALLIGMSRGRRLLIAVLQRTSATDIAARLDVHRQRVSDWVSGVRSPCPESRQCLESNYGIPVRSWDIQFVSQFGDTVRRSPMT